jgi:lysophospholipase L1-like esterase
MLPSAVVNRRLLLHAAAALPLAGAVACAGDEQVGLADPTVEPPALKAPLTYLALGASDAAGVGVDEPARDGWVPVLQRLLPQPARLVNLGIPGITLKEAVNVELPPALDAKPHLVTVWLVVNDILGGVTLEDYRADLDRLLGQLKANTTAYVAVGNVPNAPDHSGYLGLGDNQRRALTDAWNAAIAGVVGQHGYTLVDLYQRWPVAEHPEFIGPDGLHPTVDGYRSLAETFLAVLREQRIV